MIKTLIESPFAGKGPTEAERKADEAENIRYARACMHHCFQLQEAPYASHLLYTQDGVLDDDVPEERTLGIDAGLVWGAQADKTAIYLDRGFSTGMKYGVQNALDAGRPLEFRSLPDYKGLFLQHSKIRDKVTFTLDHRWKEGLDGLLKGAYTDLLRIGKVEGSLSDFLDTLFNGPDDATK